jgi:hypothetical protein
VPAQVLNVQVPQLFKNVVDALNIDFTSESTVWVVAGSLVLGCPFFLLLPLPPATDGAYQTAQRAQAQRSSASCSTPCSRR